MSVDAKELDAIAAACPTPIGIKRVSAQNTRCFLPHSTQLCFVQLLSLVEMTRRGKGFVTAERFKQTIVSSGFHRRVANSKPRKAAAAAAAAGAEDEQDGDS